jgi:HEPN domain-containing protein
VPLYKDMPGLPEEWLRRARGNLALGKIDKPAEVYFEELCYNLQQAAEKAIKGIILHKKLGFPFTHDIETLLSTLREEGVNIPENILEAIRLTEYAVEVRYPGFRETVSEKEYQEAVRLAEQVVAWAEGIIGK